MAITVITEFFTVQSLVPCTKWKKRKARAPMFTVVIAVNTDLKHGSKFRQVVVNDDLLHIIQHRTSWHTVGVYYLLSFLDTYRKQSKGNRSPVPHSFS